MPVKLSAIEGLTLEKRCQNIYPMVPHAPTIHAAIRNEGFNMCIKELGSKQIGLNRERLWKLIYNAGNGSDWDSQSIADAIIREEETLLESKP